MSPINLQAEERAFQTLFELIRTREIRPGERVYETELAERFSMSRTPLRHAILNSRHICNYRWSLTLQIL